MAQAQRNKGADMMTLPPSLAVTPNIPPREQTILQLQAEIAYWRSRLDRAGQSSGAVCAEFIQDCEREIRLRQHRMMQVPRKIYVASPFANQEVSRMVAGKLIGRGHEVTAAWLHAEAVDMADAEASRIAAERDVLDVLRADTLLVLTDFRPVGAGHHVEFGLALAVRYLRPQPMFVVVAGPVKSIFHHMADRYYEDWSQALAGDWL